jgi:hypothetical protein
VKAPQNGKRSPSLNLIQIQERYIEEVNAAFARWDHRPKPPWEAAGGHFGRRRRAAYRQALRALRGWGFNDNEAGQMLKQADDIAELERKAR